MPSGNHVSHWACARSEIEIEHSANTGNTASDWIIRMRACETNARDFIHAPSLSATSTRSYLKWSRQDAGTFKSGRCSRNFGRETRGFVIVCPCIHPFIHDATEVTCEHDQFNGHLLLRVYATVACGI